VPTPNEALSALTLSDPLAYGIVYIDLLQGVQWEVDKGRAWIKEIYSSVNPYVIEKEPVGHARHMVIMKGTQVGMTIMAAVKMFHFADNWPVRVMYMLPRQQDYIDFATTRIDPMIAASTRLQDKIGIPNSTRSKKLGNSYLFFMESTVEPRSMPADAIMVDEVDLSDPANVNTLLNRMDNSNWKLRYYFSTPTLPNYGIHGRYLLSDRRKWLVKCPRCNKHQEMQWEENLRVIGRQDEPDDVYLVCTDCDKRITLDIISEHGQWVAEKPEKSDDIIGFHISQLMNHTPAELYKFFLDPETSMLEFYRKRLGKPYEIAGGSVSREDFLANCFHQYAAFPEDIAYDGQSKYYAGIDQGNEIQIVIAKIPPGGKIPQIVHVELIPFPPEDNPTDPDAGWNRVGKLLRLFKVKKAVSDASPNRHSVRALQGDFLGRLVMADYTEIKSRFAVKKNPEKVVVGVNVNRVESFDDLMESIRESYWALPGVPPILSPNTEILISHVTSLKRDIEERRTSAGVKRIPVWRKLRADHLAHCMLYCKLAIEIDTGAHHKIAIIGGAVQPGVSEEETKEEIVEGGYVPHANDIALLLPKLSSVRQEQAQIYFNLKQSGKLEKTKLPLYLQHGINQAKALGGKIEDIEWILMHIALYDNKPIKT
jgi:hypothetical protein